MRPQRIVTSMLTAHDLHVVGLVDSGIRHSVDLHALQVNTAAPVTGCRSLRQQGQQGLGITLKRSRYLELMVVSFTGGCVARMVGLNAPTLVILCGTISGTGEGRDTSTIGPMQTAQSRCNRGRPAAMGV
ncbi:hypothetical protein E4U55_000729 [Claviceps digitariae]|nr:hypothetical protein E4U55_000729 [Claviceps digitariae]